MTDVDGAEVLDRIAAFISRYLAAPSVHCVPTLALWAMHTWCVQAFYVTPRLVIDSPEAGSGKTRVLELLARLCRDPEMTLSATTAALYRMIAAAGDAPPAILQDEADAIFGRTATPQAEDLRALYNAGYKRGATVSRCEGDAKNMKVRRFPVFAPVALAGLAGRMPPTITSRAVVMHWRKRAPGETVAPFRERDADAQAAPIRADMLAWAESNADRLTAARPVMPKGVEDRPAEVWEALLAVADAAGGDWPKRGRDACAHFVLHSTPDELTLGVRLLSDIRVAFADRDRMFSVDIISTLTSDEESEWLDLWGKKLDQRRLAKELKRYGVSSKTVRVGVAKAKGYEVEGPDGLAQAWERYVPADVERGKRGKRDIAGQDATDATDATDKRGKRGRSVAEKTVADQHVSESATDATDATDKYGSMGDDSQVHGDNRVHRVETEVSLRPVPGAPTASTPGMTDRVQQILARASNATAQRCGACETELETPKSIAVGLCAECRISGRKPA
jgi:hypothetical protein